MRKRFVQLISFLMERNSTSLRLLFRLAAPLGKKIRNYKVVKIEWMDECCTDTGGTLRDGGVGIAYGPMRLSDAEPRKSMVQLPEIRYHTFQNGVVSAFSSSVLRKDGVLVIERVGRYDSSDFDYSAGHIHMHRKKSALIKIIQNERIEKGIFLGGNGAFNYYHWLIEIVPKLEFLDKLPDYYHSFPLLVSQEVFKVPSFNSILKTFAPKCHVIELENNKTYDVSELLYISTPNNLPFNLRAGKTSEIWHTLMHPGSISFIRGKCLANDVLKSGEAIYPKKVFLKRKQERRKYNQNDVEQVLGRHGFVSVFMEELSFEEQVRTMHNAEWVVGPTGAAWTNIVFCKPNTNALCWMAGELKDFSAFSTIAGHVGVNLKYITYTTGQHSTADLYYADYAIDIEDIEGYISDAKVHQEHPAMSVQSGCH